DLVELEHAPSPFSLRGRIESPVDEEDFHAGAAEPGDLVADLPGEHVARHHERDAPRVSDDAALRHAFPFVGGADASCRQHLRSPPGPPEGGDYWFLVMANQVCRVNPSPPAATGFPPTPVRSTAVRANCRIPRSRRCTPVSLMPM